MKDTILHKERVNMTEDTCSITPATTWDVVSWLLYYGTMSWLIIEVLFVAVFRYYLVPRANRPTVPVDYRDYGRQRCDLMLRILDRIEATYGVGDRNVLRRRTLVFLSEWFHHTGSARKKENSTIFPSMALSPSSSPDNSDDDESSTPNPYTKGEKLRKANDSSSQTKTTTDPIILYQEDMEDFFAWAFFGKHQSTLEQWEHDELKQLFVVLKQRVDLEFPSLGTQTVRQKDHHLRRLPRRMTLEPVNAIHRPLLVYVVVRTLKFLGGCYLRYHGFRKLHTSSGYGAWYRPAAAAASSTKTTLLPMLFFHGIAPCGLLLYLPMILFGLTRETTRPVYLFENHSISCTMDFEARTEHEAVDGVIHVLKSNGHDRSPLSLIGHSFGSCPITWLLASKRLKIAQVCLLDPVTILLSEPDVMVNFLYAEELDKIRMIASSELFTEYYLRRHFAWYNSELWLEDHVEKDTQVLVCLSEQDEIINAGKVKAELERQSHKENALEVIYWKKMGHGDCIASPSRWREIKQRLLQQELKLLG